MKVRELKELLSEFDDGLEVRFDVDSVDWYGHHLSEDPAILCGQYVEDGFTEAHIPNKETQSQAESAYLLLKG